MGLCFVGVAAVLVCLGFTVEGASLDGSTCMLTPGSQGFYLISDDELLSILGTSDAQALPCSGCFQHGGFFNLSSLWGSSLLCRLLVLS